MAHLGGARQAALCFAHRVPLTADSLPDDIATLKAMVIAAEAARLTAEAEAKARALLIEQMKFTIAKLRHEQYGQSSERGAILEQFELRLGELEEDAAQAEAPGADRCRCCEQRKGQGRGLRTQAACTASV